MPRTKSSVPSRERRKKIIERAKGFYGRRKSNLRLAAEAVAHAGQYAYEHRRDKKGDMRSLWITRINGAVREHGLSYSRFIAALPKANITLNRKVLADLAATDPTAFGEVIKLVKAVAA